MTQPRNASAWFGIRFARSSGKEMMKQPATIERVKLGADSVHRLGLRRNPKEEISKCGHWWKPAEYPEATIVCPLCRLPETTGEYKTECHCWDGQPPNKKVS